MPGTVDVIEAERRFEDFVLHAEFGVEIVIPRDGAPVAQLNGVEPERRRAAFEETVERVRAFRTRAKPVTVEEVIAWKNEGRR